VLIAKYLNSGNLELERVVAILSVHRRTNLFIIVHEGLMSTHASVLVDSVGPPSAEVCRTAGSFP
jgi:hypothetical protein